MKITVQLFATFRVGRFKQEQRDYSEGITCRQVIADVGLNGGAVGMVLVNGRSASLDYALGHGDSLALFPLLGGG
jgi:molybdopterin synthase sulfur carrier subunit